MAEDAMTEAGRQDAATGHYKHPLTPRRALPMALLRAREGVMSRFRPMLAMHGLSEQQWRVMRVLAEAGTLDATTLSERANIFASSLSRILKILERRGVLLRERGENDARRVLVVLTDEGHDIISQVIPESLAIYARIEEDFGGSERVRALINLLNELSELDTSK